MTCIHRTFAGGIGPGLASGMGVATVHLLFGALGLSGLVTAGESLRLNHAGIELAGSTIVVFLAIRSFRAAAVTAYTGSRPAGTVGSAYSAAILLALSNPMTIVGMTAACSSFGVASANCPWEAAIGIFCGSALWWTVLCSVVATLRCRLSLSTMLWINRSASGMMACFGVLSIVRSIW
ncbi:MAG: LysE family transporter [Acetobacteraceae bacterium]|nr:LysE family transporter [Acetobacteraceae bacterium]